MGARGPGARPKRKPAPGAKAKRPRKLPWQKPRLSRLARVVAFLEFLPVTKGVRAGEKMALLPDQRAFLAKVYGDGSQARVGIDSKPRGNGKSGLAAGLALCHLLGPESEARGEVYAASVDRTMSGKLYAEMEAIIVAVPEFDDRVSCRRFHKQIEVLGGDGKGSTFEALSGDAKKGHGLAPTLWIFDELAQCSDFELLDNLETGMGKRTRSLGLILSTQAEDDKHRLSVMIDEGLAGVDPSLVVQLLAAPVNADPFDEAVLRSVNPALGVYLNEKDLLADMRKAKRMPDFAARYRNRRLNQRVDANEDTRIVSVEAWKACGGTFDVAALRGRRCWGGLDLSTRCDLTALALIFEPDEDDGPMPVLMRVWTPAKDLAERSQRDRAHYPLWVEQRHMIAVPGATIRYEFVACEIAALAAEYDLQGIAYDRWRIDLLKDALDAEGIEHAVMSVDGDEDVPSGVLRLVRWGQGFRDMGFAVDQIEEDILERRIAHAMHPVLTWCASNAVASHDAAGNRKPDKEKARNRIDPFVALVMANGLRVRSTQPAPAGSIWDDIAREDAARDAMQRATALAAASA